MAATKKRHNKQTTTHGASFKRLAKAIRQIAKKHGFSKQSFLIDVAGACDNEAAALRAMR